MTGYVLAYDIQQLPIHCQAPW